MIEIDNFEKTLYNIEYSAISANVELVSEEFEIGETFKKFGYEKNWMLHNSYYKYLMALCATLRPKNVLELGTQIGSGAACMSKFSKHVLTVDVNISEVSHKVLTSEKIEVRKIEKSEQCLLFDFSKFDLIFVDIDHTGFFEYLLHQEFLKQYKGIVLWDDIKINDGMIKFWDKVDIKKYDLMWHDNCGFGISIYE